MILPDGFRHVGDGWLDVDEIRLQQLRVPQDLAEIYDIEESWFAKGKYGIVRRAVDKKTGVNYAAKFLRRRRRGQCCAKEINHEIAVLMLCAHSRHIVRLHAVHETRQETALILELATGGELQTMIDSKGQLTEAQTRSCMREILRALHHLHKQSIAHLDLKPQNILLVGNDVEDGLKLCDFGIARIVGDTGKIYEILGTPDYVAPEVLHYEPLSLQTDIWSIGVLTYVLLTGCSPFGGDNKQETFLNITKCLLTFPEDLFEDVSAEAIDFIRSALQIKPKERPTVEECLEHRWLSEDEVICPASEQLAANVTAELLATAAADEAESTNQTSSNSELQQIAAEEEQEVEQEQRSLSSSTSSLSEVDVDESAVIQSNGHSGVSKEAEPVELECVRASHIEELDEAETNKENVLLVQSAAGFHQAPIQPASVVEIVSVSLFPDAPTTPKVSRKAPPSEHQQNGQLHLSTTPTTTGSTTTPNSVKAYVQKLQQQNLQSHSHHGHHHHHHHHHHLHNHQQQDVLMPTSIESGFRSAAAATLCCLKGGEESSPAGAAAAGLAAAVVSVASRKSLQCGDKGIIC